MGEIRIHNASRVGLDGLRDRRDEDEDEAEEEMNRNSREGIG